VFEFGYLCVWIRYLSMHHFQKEIEGFLKTQLHDKQLEIQTENVDVISLTLKNVQKRLVIVFHYLDETPLLHYKKMTTNFSNEKKRIIHLWEDLWKFHEIKIKSRLNSMVGNSRRIHGRETSIQSINNIQLLAFLDENHLNVPIKAKYKYGLFQNDVLLAVISFSKGRMIQRGGALYNSFEMLRFCNKLNHTVVGGFSKLLNHFIKELSPDDIMTYVDKDWSDGTSYSKAGFVLEDQLQPIEFFLDQISGQRQYSERGGVALQESGVKVYNSGSYKFIKYLK